MLTQQEKDELKRVADKVIKAYKADTKSREEDRVYEEHGPHGLAMLHIARDAAVARAQDARIAASIQRSKAQAADEALANSLVDPAILQAMAAPPRRAKLRKKPLQP